MNDRIEKITDPVTGEIEYVVGKIPEPSQDVVVLEFSTDPDVGARYQTADGVWHKGLLPFKLPHKEAIQ